MKKMLAISVIAGFLITSFSFSVLADQAEVVTLGADLSPAQQEQILDWFGVQREDVLVLTVSNEEERQYLEGIATEEQIGTNAFSSAHLKLAAKDTGIKVKTNHITWVTEEMYAGALVTAGVENAEVNITAPFNVSGTAALTGVMKAFEEATGKQISTEAKKTANEELVVTSDLADGIGKEQAVQLIQKIKQRVVKDKVTSPADIRKIIEFIASELDITLTDSQIEQILTLMEKISRLDLNVDKISEQIGKISSDLDSLRRAVEKNKGLIQKILDKINVFFSWLRQVLNKA